MAQNYTRLLYGLGVAVFLNPFTWLFVLIYVVVKGFAWAMLYQISISIIGFILIARFLRDDVVEFNLNFRRALLQSLIYLAMCLIVPFGELAFLYAVMGFPPRLPSVGLTANDLVAVMMANYVPVLIAALMPVYALAITILSVRWARLAVRGGESPVN
ncbi:MAG: hypothetical protein ACP5GZ_03385 [Vulcanisaeta sp.]|uniref:hypothetical protein n=1 Tax=Vulcanisaeta sp. TaxID=2020871 RepID=UPI003D150F61